MWKPSFTIGQLEFIASIKTQVTIQPKFNGKEMYFISGKVGPFKANQDLSVPLWLALHLKSLQKCEILQPFWFQEEELQRFMENEKSNKNDLTNLQIDEFFEISYIFLSKSPQNIKKISLVRGTIQGIQNIRKQKIRKLFEQNRGSLRLKNLTTYQANKLREPLSKLAVMVDRLKKSDNQRNKKQ